MRYTVWVLPILLLGCKDGYGPTIDAANMAMFEAGQRAGQETSDRSERDALIKADPSFKAAVRTIDSLYALGPHVRSMRRDSIAHVDSLAWAKVILQTMRMKYHLRRDTIGAVFTYLQYYDYLDAVPMAGRVDEVRRYAGTVGSVLEQTLSPNMARIAYYAFERAKRLALDYGDPHYIHLADSSYRAVARQVMTMPDSVRAAFGPPPDRPARVPWVLATLAAAFIAISLSRVKAGQGQNVFGKATALG